jgi:ABC-type polysaccharide/polyol phosphate transport system ATPase subunit
MYKLYDKPSDRLKEALGLSKKKRYREIYALKDVSFDVARGETVGIIGTNGSGKSTILKIITGVLTPTSGEVTADGQISLGAEAVALDELRKTWEDRLEQVYPCNIKTPADKAENVSFEAKTWPAP